MHSCCVHKQIGLKAQFTFIFIDDHTHAREVSRRVSCTKKISKNCAILSEDISLYELSIH